MWHLAWAGGHKAPWPRVYFPTALSRGGKRRRRGTNLRNAVMGPVIPVTPQGPHWLAGDPSLQPALALEKLLFSQGRLWCLASLVMLLVFNHGQMRSRLGMGWEVSVIGRKGGN